MDATPINVARVMNTLMNRGIEPRYAEYPKWVGAGDMAKIVHSDEEERAYLEKVEGDAEAARQEASEQAGQMASGAPSTAANSINPLRDRPPYEAGALPGEPGGQDGPEASPVKLGTDNAKSPPQTIEPVHNEPDKSQDIDTAQGLNDAPASHTVTHNS